MNRKLVVFSTLEEKQKGLHGKKIVPADAVYLFQHVWGGTVETRDFAVPIRVYFLDVAYRPLPTSKWSGGARYLVQDKNSALLKPNGILVIPSIAAHFVELGFSAPPMKQDDWEWLWRQV